MRRFKNVWWMAALGLTFAAGWASAQLGDILIGIGITLFVDRFGDDINDGINTLLGQNDVEVAEATKVVPIWSLGQGTHVGAAQVAGPADRVKRVKGVAELEGRFIGKRVRARIYIPVATDRPKNLGLDRVEAVATSAVLEIRL